jgi:hypothetical protein
MQIASESGKAADGVWISISADGDEQLTCTYIEPSDSRLLYNLAVAQQAAGMNKPAIDTLQPLLAIASPDPDALDLAAAA